MPSRPPAETGAIKDTFPSKIKVKELSKAARAFTGFCGRAAGMATDTGARDGVVIL